LDLELLAAPELDIGGCGNIGRTPVLHQAGCFLINLED
jgi:hypothetical protein